MSEAPTIRSTPLRDEHARLGATFTDFGGWRMPLRYSSDLAEHRAVRTAAGLFDLSHMGEVRVEGPQAGAALDHALVSRISTVAIGRAKYSLLCAEDGGILDDLISYRLAEDRFLVVPNAANAATVVTALTERAAGFDARVTDVSSQTSLVAVQGPAAPAIVTSLLPAEEREPVSALRYYAATTATVAGVDGAPRAHRLHRRGRLRAVRGGRAGTRPVGRAARRRRGARPRAGRPGRARLAAPRGGHAAVRPRADPHHRPLRRRARRRRRPGPGARPRRARRPRGRTDARTRRARAGCSSACGAPGAGPRGRSSRSSSARTWSAR